MFKVQEFRDVPHFALKLAVESALRESSSQRVHIYKKGSSRDQPLELPGYLSVFYDVFAPPVLHGNKLSRVVSPKAQDAVVRFELSVRQRGCLPAHANQARVKFAESFRL